MLGYCCLKTLFLLLFNVFCQWRLPGQQSMCWGLGALTHTCGLTSRHLSPTLSGMGSRTSISSLGSEEMGTLGFPNLCLLIFQQFLLPSTGSGGLGVGVGRVGAGLSVPHGTSLWARWWLSQPWAGNTTCIWRELWPGEPLTHAPSRYRVHPGMGCILCGVAIHDGLEWHVIWKERLDSPSLACQSGCWWEGNLAAGGLHVLVCTPRLGKGPVAGSLHSPRHIPKPEGARSQVANKSYHDRSRKRLWKNRKS